MTNASSFLNLHDKVAVVTGGNRGIGQAIAQGFARFGAKVAIVNRDGPSGEKVADEIRSTYSGEVTGFQADVSQTEEVDAAIEHTLKTFGRIDILVNNAGIINRLPINEAQPEDWDTLMRVNAKGPWLMARAVGPHMIERGSGKVVNISSIIDTLGIPDRTLYGMSKGGLTQLTRVLAIEWAMHNIQVNTVSPGTTRTDMLRNLEQTNPEGFKAIVEAVPMKRIADAEEVANAVIFLASDAASYITGQTLYVDGGWLYA